MFDKLNGDNIYLGNGYVPIVENISYILKKARWVYLDKDCSHVDIIGNKSVFSSDKHIWIRIGHMFTHYLD